MLATPTQICLYMWSLWWRKLINYSYMCTCTWWVTWIFLTEINQGFCLGYIPIWKWWSWLSSWIISCLCINLLLDACHGCFVEDWFVGNKVGTMSSTLHSISAYPRRAKLMSAIVIVVNLQKKVDSSLIDPKLPVSL